MLVTEREDVSGGWRKLYDEEPNDLCSSQDVVRIRNFNRTSLEDDVINDKTIAGGRRLPDFKTFGT